GIVAGDMIVVEAETYRGARQESLGDAEIRDVLALHQEVGAGNERAALRRSDVGPVQGAGEHGIETWNGGPGGLQQTASHRRGGSGAGLGHGVLIGARSSARRVDRGAGGAGRNRGGYAAREAARLSLQHGD